MSAYLLMIALCPDSFGARWSMSTYSLRDSDIPRQEEASEMGRMYWDLERYLAGG